MAGLVWCPVHRDYEELIEGASAIRLTLQQGTLDP